MDISDIATEHEPSEKEALKQFRKMLKDIITPDHTNDVLLKYLRAKNFNLRKSEIFFRALRNFRMIFRLDDITKLTDVPDIIQDYQFIGELGIAKDGTPIRYIALGRGDFYGYELSLDIYDIMKYAASVIERDINRCKEQSRKLGKDINRITYILDMDCFPLRQVFYPGIIEIGLDLFRLLQDYYPEIWKRALIVNAPSYFSLAFNIFKPIFRSTLLQYIQVVSRNGAAELLLKYIDEDVLPAFLGGKRVDSEGNPMCAEFITFGGTIPEEHFLRNRLSLLTATDKGVTDMLLPSRCCHNYSVVVRERNSYIHVEYRTEGGSVIVSTFYRNFGLDPEMPDLPSKDEYLDELNEKCNVEMICPNIHAECHLGPYDNKLLAVKPGIYIFKFDNTCNWLSSRRLFYRIRVLPPTL